MEQEEQNYEVTGSLKLNLKSTSASKAIMVAMTTLEKTGIDVESVSAYENR